jgi:GMP synthase (glutamine-hydrolysing)
VGGTKDGTHLIVILDFGSQYTQLIARRVRECRVYSEICSCFTSPDRISELDPEGLILSGGPGSVYRSKPSLFAPIFRMGIPVLGICYGLQLAAEVFGGKVRHCEKREYGSARVKVRSSVLFHGLPREFRIWMSHGDSIMRLPRAAKVIASTETTAVAGFEYKDFYGIQFHPEVRHTRFGLKIIDNFLTRVCGAKKTWSMRKFINDSTRGIKRTAGDGKVICAVSGGIDSTVAAALTARAVGDNFIGIFVDNGLLRLNEKQEIRKMLSRRLNLKIIDARRRFLLSLRNVKEPELKRKIIGREFIRVFEQEASRIRGVKSLVQGTLYPDVIESGKGIGPAAVIKSHHNVGGLPARMKLRVIEPLRLLFKDEVREIGEKLGLPPLFVNRKPFPGPGLAVRIVGAVTPRRLDILRKADRIIQEEAEKLHIYDRIWQIFAVLLPLGSVGVMGDRRTYDSVIALRAVQSEDGMTADWVRLPNVFLRRISGRITNEVRGINRVVFDITSKPPATIEWE